MISLSSHVLDTTLGKPVAGLPLLLTLPTHKQIKSVTDEDGRCNRWPDAELSVGQYCLRFDVEAYLRTTHKRAFYPVVDVHFTIEEESHFHIPLLLSPFGFSSYRGS